MTAAGPEGTAWSCAGEGQLGVRDRVCARVGWAWNRLPRAVGTAPVLLEFRGHLDNDLRHRV